jgi:NAD+ diphosphatase
MLHEISPHLFNNEFHVLNKINEDDFVLYYQENSLLLKSDGESFAIPTKKDFPAISDTSLKSFVFSLNNVPCFLVWELPDIDINKFIYKEISTFRTLKQKEIAWAGIIGFQLFNWYILNKFCGKCGSQTNEKPDERAIICPNCNTLVFPKISPSIIVAITCNDQILLAHNSNFPGSWYSLVAGYTDIGESLEECVIREVKEEVGLDVKNIRYYKSQPWPFSSSMMIGFIAEADKNQAICVDNKEITSAEWFTRRSLPNHPPNISIAGEMIERFEKGEL